ncbi:MAG: restriction endonuclease subunit S [Candidatus Methanomethylophilaceae archaeon]|nr:restriction endonuclease subunit S [Candidatus Methanomethylophilaceae archaeon]MDD3069126.1 restriction endonuclease subunit S [Bacilli bacterium]MDY0224269.1 restriction endonuclease subunit S [Candidatus Methanomethylophilaceae archaeon]
MKASDLKASILQLAVSGKLVLQDPNDEPAGVLLKRIKDEREALLKAGKIKKGKPLAEISEDEIPFLIPDSWEWVRIGEISNYGNNVSLDASKIIDSDWILELEDVEKETGKVLEIITKSQRNSLSTKHRFDVGDVLYSKLRPYLNKVVVPEQKGYCTSEILVLNFGKYVYPRYVQAFLMSPYFVGYANECSSGMNLPRLGTEDGRNAVFALPPLSEQHRIVARIEELMPLIEAYGREEQKLSALEAGFPDALRQSILQYAVEGKLVSQKAEDGTAAELLAKIKKERDGLVKAGKIKKGTPLPPVSEEEKPFEIPASWEWVRLGEVCLKLTDGTHHSPPNTQNGEYKYISAKNITSNGIDLSNVTYINKSLHDEIYARCDPCYGDILYIKDGATTGVVTINNLREPFSLLSSVALLKIPKEINVKYLVYFMRSPYFYAYIRKEMFGTAITRVTLEKLNKAPILLPPLAEQQRIVVRVDELMGLCDRIPKKVK